jgi:hypothetical protein
MSRSELSLSLLLLLLCLVSFPASAQYGGDPGDKGRSGTNPGGLDTDPYSKGTTFESQSPQFRDADFRRAIPESGGYDSLWVQSGTDKEPRLVHRLHTTPPDRFRLNADGGPTVLRLKVCHVVESTSKPRARHVGVLVTFDGRDIREFKTRARNYKQGTVGGSQRWVSEWRTIDIPVDDGQHVVDVRASDMPGVIAGMFFIPDASAGDGSTN